MLQRGRWLNPVVFALHAVAKRLPLDKTIDRPIFVLGSGRSGTTILGTVLSFHRDVAFLNEPKALWHSVCPYEDLIGNFTTRRAQYRLSETDATSAVKQDIRRLYGVHLALSSATRVVDKYPELTFRTAFLRALFPDARFLILVRNGWDTAASIAAWSTAHARTDGASTVDWWGVNDRKWRVLVDEIISSDPAFADMLQQIRRLDRQTDMAVVEWTVAMREAMSILSESPGQARLVRFEELVRHPELLRELLNFCELPPDMGVLDYGRAVLHPVPAHAPFAMHPDLRPVFDDTMSALGYGTSP